ncbi:MAG: DUF4062 domain-containing protein [Myxococcales bacterium]|nr:DUF4062 domain-containing protein [Myxococcales bacterium]
MSDLLPKQRESVFISSTVHDLVDLRSELTSFLRELGVEPLLAEHPEFVEGGDGDASAIEVCLRRVEDADVVIVIIDGRYGVRLPDYGGISATELEFRHAHASGKNPRVFVRDRVMAAWSTWDRAGRVPGEYFPVRAGDSQELFGWLARMQDDQQWISQFTSSMDLKSRVGNILSRQVERALITAGMRDGSLPIVHICVKGFSSYPESVRYGIQLLNTGRGVVFDLALEAEGRELGRLALLDAGQRESLSWMRGEVMGEPHEYEFVVAVTFTNLLGLRVCQHWRVLRRGGRDRSTLERMALISGTAYAIGSEADGLTR